MFNQVLVGFGDMAVFESFISYNYSLTQIPVAVLSKMQMLIRLEFVGIINLSLLSYLG